MVFIVSLFGNEKRMIPLVVILSIICGLHQPIFGYLTGKITFYMVKFDCFLVLPTLFFVLETCEM